MASTMAKPVRLGELLQEQQEPFILEVYLLEKGYLKRSKSSNSVSSDDNFGCCSQANSNKFFKRSASSGLNKSTKGIPHCSKILKAVFKKLVSISENPRVKKQSDHGDGNFSVTEMGRKSHEVAELDRFSSGTSTTVFNSCSESEREETFNSSRKDHISSTADTSQACKQREYEVDTDRKLQWRTMDDRKQFSPVSVLEEALSEEVSPIHNNQARQEDNKSTSNCILNQKYSGHQSRTREEEHTSTSNFILHKKLLTEDTILSASLWELLLQPPTEISNCKGVENIQELAESKNLSHYLKSKRVLQQSKQLLFDCVREVVETHGERKRKQQATLGAEELGKLICEKIRVWGKQYGDETNITQLLHLDFLASVEEWSKFKAETREISMKIGDAIWEEMSNEIITDMIDNFWV